MIRRLTMYCVGAATLAGTADAQRTIKSIGRDLEHGVRDILWVWSSPFHADRTEWATFAGSVALVGASLLIDDGVQRAMIA